MMEVTDVHVRGARRQIDGWVEQPSGLRPVDAATFVPHAVLKHLTANFKQPCSVFVSHSAFAALGHHRTQTHTHGLFKFCRTTAGVWKEELAP